MQPTSPATPTASEAPAKSRSRLNALAHGLTAAHVYVTADEKAAYTSLVAEYFTRYQPKTDRENILTQQLADARWLILRSSVVQNNIMAACAVPQPDADGTVELDLDEYHAKLAKTARMLLNVSTYESRLRRRYEADREELETLLEARREEEQQAAKAPAPAARPEAARQQEAKRETTLVFPNGQSAPAKHAPAVPLRA